MKAVLLIALSLMFIPFNAQGVEMDKAELVDNGCMKKDPLKSLDHDPKYKGKFPKTTRKLKAHMKGKKCVIRVSYDFDNWGPWTRFTWYCKEPCGWAERADVNVMMEPNFYFENTDNGAL